METATQRDYLRENADNVWFVLGAYFFAFFPWAIMNNIDFISEKWRTCSRTRTLARRHLASYIIPIIYVAVYAEAQRRDNDNKELGAALAALMFNIYQVLRTIMGLVQLNAFVAWCKDAVECIQALQGNDRETSSSSSSSSSSSNAGSVEGGAKDEIRRMKKIVVQWQKGFLLWCKRVSARMRNLLRRDEENTEQCRNGDEEKESSVKVNVDGNDADGAEEQPGASAGENGEDGNTEAKAEVDPNPNEFVQSVERSAEGSDSGNESNSESRVSGRKGNDGDRIEDEIMVNNMVVDNELGGRDVSVLPSWVKIWRGLKKGKLTPSKWLRTDLVVLNTVRWGGAYLCGMGEGWSVVRNEYLFRSAYGEILESFFSKEMHLARCNLQVAEWVVNVKNDGFEFLSIDRLGSNDIIDLTGEKSAAYGDPLTNYDVEDTYTVDAYSFEFSSLVGSYPSSGEMYSTANRERVGVGLVHSVLLAKHLGVEKLQAIRRYYDQCRVPEGAFLRNAFALLLKQTNADIPDDAEIWKTIESDDYQIPIFPYRMQMIALWDEARNWRVLQASAHYDNGTTIDHVTRFESQNEDEKPALHKAPRPVNIFDHCAKWTTDQLEKSHGNWRGSVGVVMETVRTFLAEWIITNPKETNWEPEIPTERVEFGIEDTELGDGYYLRWTCQRELQRKVAKMSREEENFPGNPALIMLFILSFPLLKMDLRQETEAGVQDIQDGAPGGRGSVPSSTHQAIDLNVVTWHAQSCLSPQDISLIIRIDSDRNSVSLRLQNDSGDARFMWQDWVDAAMGCMQGFEEGKNGRWGYGRKIMKANLQKPMVEMCPLRIDGDGIEKTVVRTSTARMWMGWPVFDVHLCKFEVEQWLDACYVDFRGEKVADRELTSVDGIINAVILDCS